MVSQHLRSTVPHANAGKSHGQGFVRLELRDSSGIHGPQDLEQLKSIQRIPTLKFPRTLRCRELVPSHLGTSASSSVRGEGWVQTRKMMLSSEGIK